MAVVLLGLLFRQSNTKEVTYVKETGFAGATLRSWQRVVLVIVACVFLAAAGATAAVLALKYSESRSAPIGASTTSF